MTPAKKSSRLELTKEQRALVLQNTETKANESELTDNASSTQTEPDRPISPDSPRISKQ